MPYGVDKDLGGDSKDNDSWMERCVSGVMSKDKSVDKSGAIAICKAQMKKRKESEFIYDESIVNSFKSFREQWIRNTMIDKELTFEQSSALFDSYILKANILL